MDTLKTLITGLAGSSSLTGLHQLLKDRKDTPRVDLLGEQAIIKLFGGKSRKGNKRTYLGALAGDLISNTFYYSMISGAKNPVSTGLFVGLGAGIMAVVLPDKIGLNSDYVRSSDQQKLMTVGYYTVAGLIAGVSAKLLKDS